MFMNYFNNFLFIHALGALKIHLDDIFLSSTQSFVLIVNTENNTWGIGMFYTHYNFSNLI